MTGDQMDQGDLRFKLPREIIYLMKVGVLNEKSELARQDQRWTVNGQPLEIIHAFFVSIDPKDEGGAEIDAFNLAQDRRNTIKPTPVDQSAVEIGQSDVCALLNISMSTLQRFRRADRFPPSIETGNRSVRWRYDDIMNWARENNYLPD